MNFLYVFLPFCYLRWSCSQPSLRKSLDTIYFFLVLKKKKHCSKTIVPAEVCLVKAMIFPVVMYGCESWTIKKAQCQSIDAFELWCWRRPSSVPWTARRSNQSILRINPGISLEGMMLKLKLQYFGYLMRRVDSLEKTFDVGRDCGQEKGTTEDKMVGWHH